MTPKLIRFKGAVYRQAMTPEQLRGPDPILLPSIPSGWRVIMPFGPYDFSSGGANFFFVVIPEKTRGPATWKKIVTAIQRFTSQQLGRPYRTTSPNSRRVETLISGIDGIEKDGVMALLATQATKGRVWTIFDPDQQRLRPVQYAPT